MKGWIRWGLIGVLIALISTPMIHKVNAEESLGVSGSFAGMTFLMTLGETLENPKVDVIFFNTGKTDLTLELSAQAPIGVRFRFKETTVTIPSEGSLRIPIVLMTEPDLAEGNYELSVTATIRNESGLSINAFATLKARLTVIGEAGTVMIQAQDVRGKPMKAALRLVRITDQGQSVSLILTYNGILQGRLVPGTYNVIAELQGIELVSKTFELKDQDELVINLTLSTILIDPFLIGPQFDTQNKITSVSIRSTFNNLAESESKVSVVMEIFLNDKPLERGTLLTLETLPSGLTSVNFTVIPTSGWQNGTYTFGLSLVSSDGVILAQSEARSLQVDSQGNFALSGFGIWGLAVMLMILFWRKRAKENASS